MFGRNKNRRRKSWRERLNDWASAGWSGVRRVIPWLVAVVVAVGLPYGAMYLYLGAASSTHFDIDTVEVKGVDYLDGSEIARRAHIVEGMNVLDIDEARVADKLESSPWVRSAQVQTHLPGEAVVTIDEREPVALLADSNWGLVDKKGKVFKHLERTDPVDRLMELPLVTGLDTRDLTRSSGRRWLDRALRAASLYRELGLSERAPLSEIHVDRTMGVSLVTADGTEIRLGRERYRERLSRLPAIRRKIRARSVRPSYILLDLGKPLRRVAIGRRRADQGRSATPSSPTGGAATEATREGR